MHLDGDLARAAADSAADIRRRFFDQDGRLSTLPAKLSRRLAALDVVVQRFVPGVYYTETEVNRELIGVFDDYVRLRRELVDARLLDRADGRYWRCGGSVDTAADGQQANDGPRGGPRHGPADSGPGSASSAEAADNEPGSASSGEPADG
jgi:hypothetical protein